MFEKTSTLTLTNVRTEDSGQYMCVALNPAGKVEANFTLQVKNNEYKNPPHNHLPVANHYLILILWVFYNIVFFRLTILSEG